MIVLARLAAVALAAAAAVSVAPRAADTAAPDDYPTGAALFARHCAVCHTLGGGPSMGPDLQGVTLRRSSAWLLAWIDDPAAAARADTTAAALVEQWGWLMPQVELTGPQILDIVDFLTAVDAEEVGEEELARAAAASAAHCGRGHRHLGGMAAGGEAGPGPEACPIHAARMENGQGACRMGQGTGQTTGGCPMCAAAGGGQGQGNGHHHRGH